MDETRYDPAALIAHYRRIAADSSGSGARTETAGGGSFEGDGGGGNFDEYLRETRFQLREIVRNHLGNDPELVEIADQIVTAGEPAVRALSERDEGALADPQQLRALEVIVASDGSRPSFLVRRGIPDLTTSLVGKWRLTMEDQRDGLEAALKCVGRIDDPSSPIGYWGTGSLIASNVVLTNRHVLQKIASQGEGATWRLKAGVCIDFGHEWRARDSIGRREITGVLFAGAHAIPERTVDLSLPDVALLALGTPAGAETSSRPLKLDIAPDWDDPAQGLFIAGYPGRPDDDKYEPSLLERLFKSTYGRKRIAPGHVMTRASTLAKSPKGWSIAHDATTLGGNSGSAILVIGRTDRAAGLHFGGRHQPPRENWAHVLGRLLDERDGSSGRSLREVLTEHDVELVDGGNV